MLQNIWWSLPLTLRVFFASRRLAGRVRVPLLNPLLVSMVVIIMLLLATGIPYNRYFAGSKVLNDLLQPAVVALAYLLYEQLHQIHSRPQEIHYQHLLCRQPDRHDKRRSHCAMNGGFSPEMAASILPKSVTTPIAMAVSIHWWHSRRDGGVRHFRRDSWSGFRPQRVQAAADLYAGIAWAGNGHRPLRRAGFSRRGIQFAGVSCLRHYYVTYLHFMFQLLFKLFG